MCPRIVSPFAGEWIEISHHVNFAIIHLVSPFAGEWIEIKIRQVAIHPLASHPSRVSGLKYGIIKSLCM